jgi:hypothetical protein
MYFPCWIAVGPPKLTPSPTTLEYFYGHGFEPHKILQYFSMTLKSKTISVNIKVVDAPLNYNLLLGCSWFNAMASITSIVFCILYFPHQGKIITTDQLDYETPYLHNVVANDVPFLGQSSLESVGVDLLKDSSLMGFFPLPSPTTLQVFALNMILTQVRQSLKSYDPLVVPGLDEHGSFSLSSLLKNEIDHHPFKSSLTLDHVLEAYSPPPSENVPISNQMPKRGKKKSHHRKQRLGGSSLASRNHAGMNLVYYII